MILFLEKMREKTKLDDFLGYPHVSAFAFYFAVSVAVTWPLLLHWRQAVPGWYVADNYEYLWKMWWFMRSLLSGEGIAMFAPRIFYPYGYHLALSEITPLHTLFGLPLTLLWGEISTYNFFAFLSFVLSGWATFGLVYQLGCGFWPALFSGVLYMLTPYHVVRYGGILPLMSVEGIPLFLWACEGWLQQRDKRWALFAGASFVIGAWASQYYALGLIIFGGLYLAIRLWPYADSLSDRNIWIGLALIGLISFAGLFGAMMPALQVRNQISLHIPLEETDYWSASLSDYFIPPGLHPLWGRWVREHLLGVPAEYASVGLEFVLGAGFVCLLFAFYGWKKSGNYARRAIFWFALVSLVLSLGPRLHIGRFPVVIPASGEALQAFHRVMNAIGAALPAHEVYAPLEAGGIAIPLPALFLRWMFPALEGMRAWNRFAGFATLGLAVLAGLGMEAWLKQDIHAKTGASSARLAYYAIIVLALAIFELWPVQIPLQAVEPRAVDLWLASQPDDFTIMELPLTSALSGPQMLYTRYHEKRIAFAAGYLPYFYYDEFPELEKCPAENCLNRLRSWEVRYILLNRAALTAAQDLEARLEASPALQPVDIFDDIVVYQLVEE